MNTAQYPKFVRLYGMQILTWLNMLCSAAVLEGLLHSNGIGSGRGMPARMSTPTLCGKLGHHMYWNQFGVAGRDDSKASNGEPP
jgi:hypothetical protein